MYSVLGVEELTRSETAKGNAQILHRAIQSIEELAAILDDELEVRRPVTRGVLSNGASIVSGRVCCQVGKLACLVGRHINSLQCSIHDVNCVYIAAYESAFQVNFNIERKSVLALVKL